MTTATRAIRNSPVLQSGQCVRDWGRVRDWSRKVFAILKDLGPYAAIELILPGGSVIAVLLWLYRRSTVRSTPQPAYHAPADFYRVRARRGPLV
jgi:hypothetical protein